VITVTAVQRVRPGSAARVDSLMADLTQLQDAFIMAIPQFLRQSIIMIGSIGMMIYLSPRLTGVMVACFPPTIIGAILIGRMVGSWLRSRPEAAGS